MLTDLVEIHFIELPKFRKMQHKNYKDNALQRWLAFLETDISKNMLEELMQMEPAIKMAQLEMAKKLIDSGMDIEMVMSITELMEDEMKALGENEY